MYVLIVFDLHAQYEIIKATNITTPTLSKIISIRPRRFIFPVTWLLNIFAFSSPMVPVCNQVNNQHYLGILVKQNIQTLQLPFTLFSNTSIGVSHQCLQDKSMEFCKSRKAIKCQIGCSTLQCTRIHLLFRTISEWFPNGCFPVTKGHQFHLLQRLIQCFSYFIANQCMDLY